MGFSSAQGANRLVGALHLNWRGSLAEAINSGKSYVPSWSAVRKGCTGCTERAMAIGEDTY